MKKREVKDIIEYLPDAEVFLFLSEKEKAELMKRTPQFKRILGGLLFHNRFTAEGQVTTEELDNQVAEIVGNDLMDLGGVFSQEAIVKGLAESVNVVIPENERRICVPITYGVIRSLAKGLFQRRTQNS